MQLLIVFYLPVPASVYLSLVSGAVAWLPDYYWAAAILWAKARTIDLSASVAANVSRRMADADLAPSASADGQKGPNDYDPDYMKSEYLDLVPQVLRCRLRPLHCTHEISQANRTREDSQVR